MALRRSVKVLWLVTILCSIVWLPGSRVDAEDEVDEPTVKGNIGKAKDGSKTDDEVVQREEEAIKIDGLSVAEVKQLKEKAEKHAFQAEVSRMMNLIINSVYRDKSIFLRELISNASDALDKIRLVSLTDPNALSATEELSIRIKADRENHLLHIIDSGIGMTKADLIDNLGTIARSGTADFLSKLVESTSSQQSLTQQQQDMIGQFGVGFYSAFLVSDRVVVTSKHNDDSQYIWESDSNSFSIVEDPRGPTLKRGTHLTLHLKEEAYDYLEPDTLKDLILKYSQFINFNIYLWQSRTETVEIPAEETEETSIKEDEDGKVEEEKEKKQKTIEKTTWDWQLINDRKPLWTRKSSEIEEKEYIDFYKSGLLNSNNPLTYTHFKAEGEVTFTALLYVPWDSPNDIFQNYGIVKENIKLYVRRVFITDNLKEMLPKYLSFIRGVVDSDELPLNLSREVLQQDKLLKVIKKKLVRKVLDMLKKLEPNEYEQFWKEFSTNIKLGIIEDPTNKGRLSKLLRFYSSNHPENRTSLEEYVERMKDKQDAIFYMAGTSRKEVESSPLVERLLKENYEVLYLIEPVDEHTIQSLTEFEEKKFQNVAKEGLKIEDDAKGKETWEELQNIFDPFCKWLQYTALKDLIEKAVLSQRLTNSPSALIASSYGWSGNMERIMKSQAYAKTADPMQEFYANQKKIFEINPRHPIIKELMRRVKSDRQDPQALSAAKLLFETATLRSGYMLNDQVGFAKRIEEILRSSLDMSPDEQIEEDEYEDHKADETEETETESGEKGTEEEETTKTNDEPITVQEKNSEL